MAFKKSMVTKEDVIQAVLIADNFDDEFVPISNDIPLSLIPLGNRPIIDYTLEFLSLGGIEEVFIFCCQHVEAIKKHIDNNIKNDSEWSRTMKANVIVSESCRSFGDCLRDLDAKGLLRNTFVLAEPGVISNMKLLPIIKKHSETLKKDKGVAMTLIYQESGVGSLARCLKEELVIASSKDNRIIFHKKLGCSREKKIDFPLEIFLDNSLVNIHHNLKDTHIAICSPSVLPLFTDNFDFQTRDDFIRGLLMNEEILGSTLYWHPVSGNQYGGAVTNWRTYQAISSELVNRWIYPIMPSSKTSYSVDESVVIGSRCQKAENVKICKSVIGNNVKIGKNVYIENSFIFDNVVIKDNCKITHSIISYNSQILTNSKVTAGSIIGNNVVLPKDSFIENSTIQAIKPADFDSKDKVGEKAYRLKLWDSEQESTVEEKVLAKRLSRLHISDVFSESEDESDHTTDSDDELSYTTSPVPDDTNMFYMEVVDSLTRGFEDKLACDNLILEINSSRYAYNVTLKEVNFNVVKALLNLPFQNTSASYWPSLRQVLLYFAPILKNYIRNESAMNDCLLAIQDVAITSNELQNIIIQVLNWLYDKDYLSEDSIANWFENLGQDNHLHQKVRPFIDWLQEAEEASSEDDED